MGKTLVGILTGLLALLGIGWLGLQVKPRTFAPYAEPGPALRTVPLPEGLPAPVARYYRALYGEEVPVLTSAVVTGRATMRPFGPITLPARFRFVYEAGHGYRHYSEATWFGLTVMRVNEWFLDGHGRLELPVGVVEGPHTDQGGNLGLWAEHTFLPAVWLTDPRVRWEAIDDDTALLVLPFGEGEQRFVARFDPQSGRLRLLEAMRYRDEAGDLILWLAATVPGPTVSAGGATLDAAGAATWMDQGRPWATFVAEEVVYNVDVREYIRARGE